MLGGVIITIIQRQRKKSELRWPKSNSTGRATTWIHRSISASISRPSTSKSTRAASFRRWSTTVKPFASRRSSSSIWMTRSPSRRCARRALMTKHECVCGPSWSMKICTCTAASSACASSSVTRRLQPVPWNSRSTSMRCPRPFASKTIAST